MCNRSKRREVSAVDSCPQTSQYGIPSDRLQVNKQALQFFKNSYYKAGKKKKDIVDRGPEKEKGSKIHKQ